MFHVKGGLYFEKYADGKVGIVKRLTANEDAPIVFEEVLSEGSWCSIIASMSKHGEGNSGYYRARHFHLVEGGIKNISVECPRGREYAVAVFEGTRAADVVAEMRPGLGVDSAAKVNLQQNEDILSPNEVVKVEENDVFSLVVITGGV